METGRLAPARPSLGAWERIAGVANLVRFRTAPAGAALCVTGSRLAEERADVVEVALTAIGIAFLIAFAQAFNEIVDRDLDAQSKPQRPLPSGAVSLPVARSIAGACAALGVLAAAIADPRLVPFALILVVLSWLYSRRLKDTVLLGNLVVAALASSCVPYGAVIGGLDGRVFAAQGVVFSFSLAMELLKTTIDARGDAAAGIGTLASRYGVRAGARCSAAMCVVAALAALALTPLASNAVLYATAITVGAVILTLASAYLLWTRRPEENELERSLQLLRVAWLGGIVSLLLL
ncbi:MAG TPA: UbiA family prenyltransferase [Solirubrobacterales bacterium]